MDDTPYHSKLVDSEPTTRGKKHELVTWLEEQGILVPVNATVVLLRQLCKLHGSQLKRFIIDEMIKENGYSVLFPPYPIFLNPIEKVCSETKSWYSSNVTSWPGRGMEHAKSVWAEALNRVTPEKWNRYITYTEKLILDYWHKEIKHFPEVSELIIDLQDSEEENETQEMDSS